MYKLCFTVPLSHCEQVKEAIFKAGAGYQDNYDQCAWSVEGLGQFRPLKGSKPFIGNQNQLETVKEVKVETICEEKYINQVIKALISAHPYESPSYEIIELKTISL